MAWVLDFKTEAVWFSTCPGREDNVPVGKVLYTINCVPLYPRDSIGTHTRWELSDSLSIIDTIVLF